MGSFGDLVSKEVYVTKIRLKFDNFKFTGFFAEVMDKRSRQRFEKAFSKPIRRTIRIGTDERGDPIMKRIIIVPMDDRQWVRDVVTVFQSKVGGLPLAITVQSLKTADHMAIQRAHAKIASKLPEKNREYEEVQENGQIEKVTHPSVRIARMEWQDFNDWLRNQWDYALNVRHPSQRVMEKAA
jgi:hypothetical protein